MPAEFSQYKSKRSSAEKSFGTNVAEFRRIKNNGRTQTHLRLKPQGRST